jgi:hypothetical protein
MPERSEIVDTMAGLALFADLTRAQVEGVSHIFEEQWFAEGERILRQGLGGSALYVILEGEAAVHVDGQRRAALSRGDFFGEISVLLGDPPSADVVAVRPVCCAVPAGPGRMGPDRLCPRGSSFQVPCVRLGPPQAGADGTRSTVSRGGPAIPSPPPVCDAGPLPRAGADGTRSTVPVGQLPSRPCVTLDPGAGADGT